MLVLNEQLISDYISLFLYTLSSFSNKDFNNLCDHLIKKAFIIKLTFD